MLIAVVHSLINCVCVCMYVCSSTGTLTAVESFLTVKAGSDVSNYITHIPFILLIPFFLFYI